MSTLRITEQPSLYDHLEKKSVAEIIKDINDEDKKVPMAIEKALPELEKIISAIENQLRNGGRMFYVGCGTGGRLSVLDQVELPNTYGIDPEQIQCILAGGVENLVLALEEAEDDIKLSKSERKEIERLKINEARAKHAEMSGDEGYSDEDLEKIRAARKRMAEMFGDDYKDE